MFTGLLKATDVLLPSCPCSIFLLLGALHIFFLLFLFFLLIQQLTRRHPAAPLLDKVETRLGAEQLIQSYLIKDCMSLLFSQAPAMGQAPPVSPAS